jgi:hypothetical protein
MAGYPVAVQAGCPSEESAEHPGSRCAPGQDPGRLPRPGGAQRRDQPGDVLRPVEAGLTGGISVQQGPGCFVLPGGA